MKAAGGANLEGLGLTKEELAWLRAAADDPLERFGLKEMEFGEAIVREKRVRLCRGGFRLQPFGRTPRERLTWLLGITYLDPRTLSPNQRQRLYEVLALLVDSTSGKRWEVQPLAHAPTGKVYRSDDPPTWKGAPRILQEAFRQLRYSERPQRQPRSFFRGEWHQMAPADPLPDLLEAQERLRAAFEAIIAGQPYTQRVENRAVSVECLPAGRVQTRAATDDTPAEWESRETLLVRDTVTAPLADAAVVAALQLAAQTPASLLRRCPYPQCGRVFIGIKRQRRCTPHRWEARRAQWRERQRRRRRPEPPEPADAEDRLDSVSTDRL